MSIIGWIVLGAIGGWIGGLLVKGDEGHGGHQATSCSASSGR